MPIGRPRSVVAALPAYRPGKDAAQAEAEHGITDAIKLASNENPLPPLPSVLAAINDAAAGLNRYADHRATAVRHRLADWLGRRGRRGNRGVRLGRTATATRPHLRRSWRRGGVPVALVRGVPGVHPARRWGGRHGPPRRRCVRSRRRGGGDHRTRPSSSSWRRRTTRPVGPCRPPSWPTSSLVFPTT